MEELFNRIKTLRRAKNISQAEVGERLGMSQNNYGLLERGQIDITLKRLGQIAEILDTSVPDLISPEIVEQAYSNENASKDTEIEILKLQNESLKAQKLLMEKEKEVEELKNTIAFNRGDMWSVIHLIKIVQRFLDKAYLDEGSTDEAITQCHLLFHQTFEACYKEEKHKNLREMAKTLQLDPSSLDHLSAREVYEHMIKKTLEKYLALKKIL